MKTALFLATVAVGQEENTNTAIPQTDAVDAVPTSTENAAVFQANLDLINEKRQHHCAMPYKWSPELARNAQIIADCWEENCDKETRMHSTKSWLSFEASEDVLDQDGQQKVVRSDGNVFSSLDAAAGGWYNADEDKPPTDYEFTTDMIKNVEELGAGHVSNLYVSLVWRGGLNMGCAVSANPNRVEEGTVVEGVAPSKSKIVCVFQGLLIGPGSLAPEQSKGGKFQYFAKELYPYQLDFATECVDAAAKYVPKTLFKFDTPADAFLQTINLYRAHTCTPAVKWDTALKNGVDGVMECYSGLSKKEGITACTEQYEEAFPSSNGGQWASILARTDYCDEANAGCGIAFNLAESRALLGVFHWFNRFKTETGRDAKTLTHSDFIDIFKGLNEDQKKDLNTFVILNWKSNTGVYCDIKDDRFDAPNEANIKKSFIVCAVRTADDSRPPAYEKGTGEDRYDEWQANLFPGSGCRKETTAPADAETALDATAAPEENEDEEAVDEDTAEENEDEDAGDATEEDAVDATEEDAVDATAEEEQE